MLLETLFQSLNPPGTFCFNVIAGERCISLGWTVSTEISIEGTYGVVAGPRLIHGCYAADSYIATLDLILDGWTGLCAILCV